MSNNKRVIVALDSNNLTEINELVDNIKDYVFGFYRREASFPGALSVVFGFLG